jgi:hypothetical protein
VCFDVRHPDSLFYCTGGFSVKKRIAINIKLAYPGLSNYSKEQKDENKQIIKGLRNARKCQRSLIFKNIKSYWSFFAV